MTEHDQEHGADRGADHGVARSPAPAEGPDFAGGPAPARGSDLVGGLDLALAQKTLAAQPFSLLVGAEVTAFGDGAATLMIPVRPELLQQNGFVHGGVLSYAADNGITFAAGTALGPAVLTSGFSIQYVRPATGVRLLARATVAHATRRQAVVRCDVIAVAADGTETLCALAQGTVRTTTT